MKTEQIRQKQQIRQNLLKRILSLTENEIKRRSRYVEDKLSKMDLYREAKTVMAYYPLRGEVDIKGLIRENSRKKRFCFPVTDLKKKKLRALMPEGSLDTFIKGPLGTREPDPVGSHEVDPGRIDLVLVPGLGFDLSKNRLGRGGGFYDRFLKLVKPPTKTIGLAFDFQILENLPINPLQDQKVDSIVCESRVI